MEKYYFEEEWKEAVLLTKENKSTVLVLDGEEVEKHLVIEPKLMTD